MPEGAYNIRADGQSVERSTTAHIDIVTKSDAVVDAAAGDDGDVAVVSHMEIVVDHLGQSALA